MAVQPTHCGMYRKPKLSLRSQCVGHVTESAYSTSICQTCWWNMIAGLTQQHTRSKDIDTQDVHKVTAKVSQVHSSCWETACLCASPRYARTTKQARLLSSVTNNYIPNCNNTQLSTVYLSIDNKPTVEYISNCRQHTQCWPHTQLSTKKTLSAIHPT